MISDDEYEEVGKELKEATKKADDYWVKIYKTKLGKIFGWYMKEKLYKLDRIVSRLETKESGMALAIHLRKNGELEEAMSVEAMI